MEKQRKFIPDLLKFTAIALMVYAHTISYLWISAPEPVSLLRDFGNYIAFTMFLFISGWVTYLAYSEKLDRGRLLKRAGIILFAYYFLAIALMLIDGSINQVSIWEVLFLQYLPGYTEFLIPFAAYSLLLVLFGRSIFNFLSSRKRLLLIGGAAFVLGELLFLVISQFADPQSYLVSTVSLFSGAEGLYRFPLLHYFPVWLAGTFVGKYGLDSLVKLNSSHLNLKNIFLFFGFVLIKFTLAGFIFTLIDADMLRRWPPSIFFILSGIVLTIVLAKLSYKFGDTLPQKLKLVVSKIASYPLLILIVHTIIISIISLWVN